MNLKRDSVKNQKLVKAPHRSAVSCTAMRRYLPSSGNSSEYVSELKAALKSCPESNHIVEFLIKNTAQVEKILALYPADDPAVIALKASPAYQKVAKWIED